jgi:putative ABC transport system permease protein
MNFGDAFRTALRSMRTSKLRTALTMLGIVIGVAAVIGVMSIGQGATANITNQLEAIGTNMITIRPGATQQAGVTSARGAAQTLTYEDALAVADPQNVPDAMAVAPLLQRSAQVVAGSTNESVSVLGTNADYLTVGNLQLSDGQFITQDNLDTSANVAVLGATVASDLYGLQSPVGQQIGVNGIAFEVAGVLVAKGGSSFTSQDDMVIIPYTTAQAKLFGGRDVRTSGRSVSSISVSATSANTINAAIAEITQTLEERHHIAFGATDDFSIQNQADLVASFSTITTLITAMLAGIAGISLIVGGIGIMNIMLVSVMERTREVGIRKAIGAKRRDILAQFLVESVVLSVCGGVIGIAVGIGMAEAVRLTGLITPIISIPAILIATFFAIGVGLFFGIYPARRAALLRPVEALRYE